MTPPASSSPSVPDWQPPSPEELSLLLPQYEITEILGVGGMGAVYKGRQAKLDRGVAIKLLSAAAAMDEDNLNFVARFEQEAQAMANLDHPGIVSVHDFGETSEGQLYLVMEFIDGMDIHQYIQHHGGQLSQEHAMSITAHVLDALDYAHGRGIIHRDIKPANILLNQEGKIKIADFGLAKKYGEGLDESVSALTTAGTALGTPDFVAPEVLEMGATVDHRADLYAVGVMLYQMLTGKLPRGRFQLPSELNSSLDSRLDDVVEKSMESNPEHRYASASAVRMDLDKILSGPVSRFVTGAAAEKKLSTVKTSKPSKGVVAKKVRKPAEKKKSNAVFYVGIGLAAVFIIGGLIVIMGKKEGDDNSKAVAAAKPRIDPRFLPKPSSSPPKKPAASSNNTAAVSKPAKPPARSKPVAPPTGLKGAFAPIDLMPLVDLKLTPQHQVENGVLHTADGINMLVNHSVRGGAEGGYVFHAELSGSPPNGMFLHFPIGNRRVGFSIDMASKEGARFLALNYKKLEPGTTNPTRLTYDRPKIKSSTPHHLVVAVSGNHITLDIDGKRLVEWEGKYGDLHYDWAPKVNGTDSRGKITLCFFGAYSIHRMQMLPPGAEVELP